MPASKPPPPNAGASARKAVYMLRDEEPGRKTSSAPCPNCGAAGNYAHFGHYMRHFDDGGGERLVRIERVRCLSCKRTHALIWKDMVPYKLRSESLHLRTFRSWAAGASMSRLLAATGIPPTSLRRTVSHAKARVRLLLACGPARGALSAAIAGLSDLRLSSMHLAEYGRMLAEGVRIGCARAWPAPPAGRATQPGGYRREPARDTLHITARGVARTMEGDPVWTRTSRRGCRSRRTSWG